jgi:uncharacterized protein YeaO (DUF488 family)
MPIKTKRWNDTQEPDDGFRLLICRYWPRGVSRKKKTWDSECYDLGPSRKLHAAFYGKQGEPLGWEEYRRQYLLEMQGDIQQELIAGLAELAAEGKTITLLCSSACEDEAHCHRTLLRELIEQRVAAIAGNRAVKRDQASEDRQLV